ncbi:dockerin type I domain-containing protein [Thioalkalivibrio sp. XN8]|uniref:dockerin type I domain-containing protein n=1 Tax=Thioalkalivibrio sp. XN8 TaxID=2712863 RepID=UPI003211DA9D
MANPDQADSDGDGTGDACQVVEVRTCDADGDGDVDRLDIGLISRARGSASSGPDDPRDANGDGQISALDARQCVIQCDAPRCAIQ